MKEYNPISTITMCPCAGLCARRLSFTRCGFARLARSREINEIVCPFPVGPAYMSQDIARILKATQKLQFTIARSQLTKADPQRRSLDEEIAAANNVVVGRVRRVVLSP